MSVSCQLHHITNMLIHRAVHTPVTCAFVGRTVSRCISRTVGRFDGRFVLLHGCCKYLFNAQLLLSFNIVYAFNFWGAHKRTRTQHFYKVKTAKNLIFLSHFVVRSLKGATPNAQKYTRRTKARSNAIEKGKDLLSQQLEAGEKDCELVMKCTSINYGAFIGRYICTYVHVYFLTAAKFYIFIEITDDGCQAVSIYVWCAIGAISFDI